jgi:hypothetical protein
VDIVANVEKEDEGAGSGIAVGIILLFLPVATLLILFGRPDLFAWLILSPFILLGVIGIVLPIFLAINLLFLVPTPKVGKRQFKDLFASDFSES